MQRSSLCAPQKLHSQTNNPAACIQDQRVRTCLHFNTKCVPSMAYRRRPRCRITSPGPPKTNQKTLRLGHLTCSCRSLTYKVIAPIISCSRSNEKPTTTFQHNSTAEASPLPRCCVEYKLPSRQNPIQIPE